MTVVQACADFVAFETHVRGVAGSTARLYSWYLGRFALAAGPMRPLRASWKAPEAFLSAMSRRGCGDHARAKAFQLLRSFYRWAMDHGHLDRNPLAGARVPLIHQRPRRFLTGAEAARLIDTARGSRATHAKRDAALLAALYYAGLRVGEALRLRPQDLDLAGGSLTVLGKGGKVATVPIHPRLESLVKDWLRQRPAEAERLFCSHANGAKVCGALDNQRVEYLCRVVYGPAAGLSGKVTPHVLRRSFATELRRRGVPIEHVQRLLRHSRIETTMLYLREVGTDELRKAVGKL